jgi:Flp pilus assembly protein TadB
MANVPPDWYDDPFVDGQYRYWDGRQWTEQTRPSAPTRQPTRDWTLLVLVVVGAVGILAATNQPSVILGLSVVLAVGTAVAVVIRQHSRRRDL